ncbi:hypothetical protein [Acinetobacter sp. PK01]|uniref:hypothetical protein n=1 Tax=Acinetobacter sp. PK01 TaxID=2930198 RepID=UPI001FB80E11|nr:hypothetical protein [Acinetobacter sp. PK01]UOG18690.1 hypothetical protein MP622_03500 [Acinetobacter sp. PK01]
MYLSIIILIGTIVLLFGYIKFHIDLQFSPDERKWYEKIRFVFPILVIPIFGVIYYYWNKYPDILIDRDTQLASKEVSTQLVWTIEGLLTPQSSPEPMSKFEETGSKYGTFGDSYGSLNTLFTGFAFSGLIISIFIQLLELRQTRKELSGQKKALTDQEIQLKKQTSILKNQYELTSFQHIEAIKQNFYHQFYALMEERRFRLKNLEVYTDLNANLSTHQYEYTTKNSVVGINAFRVYLEQIEAQLCTKINRVKQTKKTNILFMRHLFFCFESQRFYQISPILNLTDNLLMTIKDLNRNISIDQEIDIEIYINLIASSLYPEEAAIIFWYGILSPEWKKLIEETALLRYFSYGHAHDLAPIFYDLKAFGENNNWKSIYEKFNTYQQ